MKVQWKTGIRRWEKLPARLVFKQGLIIEKSQKSWVYTYAISTHVKDRVDVEILVDGKPLPKRRPSRLHVIRARLDVPFEELDIPSYSKKWSHIAKVLEHVTRPVRGQVVEYLQDDEERVLLYVRNFKDRVIVVRDVYYTNYPLKQVVWYVEVPVGHEVEFRRK